MITLFAQATAGAGTSGPAFWTVMEHLGLVAAIIGALAAFVVARRKRENVVIAPQPLEVDGNVKITPRGARYSQSTCEEKHKVVTAQYSFLEAKIAHLESHANQELGRLHDKVDVVERRHSDKLENAMRDIHATIAKLPEQIIGLLKTTGQLKDHNHDRG